MDWWPENLTDLVLIISGIATAVLVIIVSRQLSITKKEIDYRQRPWVSPELTGPNWIKFEKGDVIKFSDATNMIYDNKNKDKPKEVIFDIVIKNNGSIPASLEVIVTEKIGKITKSDLENSKEYEPAIIMPGQIDNFTSRLPYEEVMDKEKIGYVGVLIEYEIRGKTSSIGKIWKVNQDSMTVENEWIKDPDIPQGD